jgi:hypothetical protein
MMSPEQRLFMAWLRWLPDSLSQPILALVVKHLKPPLDAWDDEAKPWVWPSPLEAVLLTFAV